MKETLLSLTTIVFLCIPTVVELWDDRRGDLNKSQDVLFRVVSASILSAMAWFFWGENWFTCFNLSLAIHFMFFDYCIAAILIHNGTLEPPRGVKYHWFDYTAKRGVIDNLKIWKNLNPYVKLLIRVTYFVLSCILYFTV